MVPHARIRAIVDNFRRQQASRAAKCVSKLVVQLKDDGPHCARSLITSVARPLVTLKTYAGKCADGRFEQYGPFHHCTCQLQSSHTSDDQSLDLTQQSWAM